MPDDLILIISAHPDDMELSCSAFAFSLARQGMSIKSIVVTSERKNTFFPDGQPVGVVRESEAIVASRILELHPPLFLRYYIWELDYNILLVQLRTLIESESPDIVLTHFPVDGHLDHAIIGAVLYEIFQNSKNFKLVFFRSPGSYSFVPSDVFDLTTELLEKKWLALQAHKSQKFYEVPIGAVKKTEEFILAHRYGGNLYYELQNIIHRRLDAPN